MTFEFPVKPVSLATFVHHHSSLSYTAPANVVQISVYIVMIRGIHLGQPSPLAGFVFVSDHHYILSIYRSCSNKSHASLAKINDWFVSACVLMHQKETRLLVILHVIHTLMYKWERNRTTCREIAIAVWLVFEELWDVCYVPINLYVQDTDMYVYVLWVSALLSEAYLCAV